MSAPTDEFRRVRPTKDRKCCLLFEVLYVLLFDASDLGFGSCFASNNPNWMRMPRLSGWKVIDKESKVRCHLGTWAQNSKMAELNEVRRREVLGPTRLDLFGSFSGVRPAETSISSDGCSFAVRANIREWSDFDEYLIPS